MRTVLAAWVTALALAIAPASAMGLAAGTTVLVDRPAGAGLLPFDGTGGAGLGPHAVSADGCFVVFRTESDAFLLGDEDAAANVYRVNRCAAGSTAQVVTTTTTGSPMEAGSYADAASISADGRYVAFLSDSSALAPGSNGSRQAFRKDMATGKLDVVSRGTGAGGALSADADDPVISGDGATVAFIARGVLDAVNVDGTGTTTNAYVRRLTDDTTLMVSTTSVPAPAAYVSDVDIDHTGADVAFVTYSSLVAGDTDGGYDAYVRQGIGTVGAATKLVSFSGGGQSSGADTIGDAGAGVGISSHGQFVTYVGYASVYVTDCTGACGVAGNVSLPGTGGSTSPGSNSAPFFPRSLSGGAPVAPTSVAWLSSMKLVAADANATRDVYRHTIGDATGGSTADLTTNAADRDIVGADLTPAGTVVFATPATNLPGGDGAFDQVYAGTAPSTSLSNPAGTINQTYYAVIGRMHAISDNGRSVVFAAGSPVLGSPPGPDYPITEVFLRDTATGVISMLSRTAAAPADDYSDGAAIDAAGTKVVFSSRAGNLLPGMVAGTSHVFLRDLATGELRRLDRTSAGAVPNGYAGTPQISADGTKVAFVSRAANQDGHPGGSNTHVIETDVATGASALVDRTAAGVAGNSHADNPDISGDGSTVAFQSQATNLGGPTDGSSAVYVSRVADHGLQLGSVAPGDGVFTSAYGPALSRDGLSLAFSARGAGPVRAYARNLTAGVTTRASDGTGLPDTTDFDSSSISADGTRVAFTARVPGAWIRDVAAAVTRRIDLANGSTVAGRLPTGAASLDGTGRCVALQTRSDNLVSPSYGPDDAHVFLHAIDDCPAVAAVAAVPVVPLVLGGSVRDRVKPVIAGLAMTHRRFALGTKKTAASARKRVSRGTAFTFRLSETASVRIVVAAKAAGRRSGGRCVKPRAKLRRRCTRLVGVVTLTRRSLPAGSARVAFSGRVGKRALKPGAYRATLTATDAAGNRSAPRTIDFTVVTGR